MLSKNPTYKNLQQIMSVFLRKYEVAETNHMNVIAFFLPHAVLIPK
jgi:hypothetical protein